MDGIFLPLSHWPLYWTDAVLWTKLVLTFENSIISWRNYSWKQNPESYAAVREKM